MHFLHSSSNGCSYIFIPLTFWASFGYSSTQGQPFRPGTRPGHFFVFFLEKMHFLHSSSNGCSYIFIPLTFGASFGCQKMKTCLFDIYSLKNWHHFSSRSVMIKFRIFIKTNFVVDCSATIKTWFLIKDSPCFYQGTLGKYLCAVPPMFLMRLLYEKFKFVQETERFGNDVLKKRPLRIFTFRST